MSKRGVLWLAGVLLVVAVAFLALVSRPAIAPIELPAASLFAPEQVAHGNAAA